MTEKWRASKNISCIAGEASWQIPARLEVMSLADNKIPNFKHQITIKSQISNINDPNLQHSNK
jgi:hypothetical protein